MNIDEIKAAVKEAAEETVGSRLDEFDTRLKAMEDNQISKDDFEALKTDLESVKSAGSEEQESEEDKEKAAAKQESEEVSEADLDEAIKSYLEENYGEALKSLSSSQQVVEEDESTPATSTKSAARRDAFGRRKRGVAA